MNTLKQKPNRANGILAKLRHFISADILKTIQYPLFDSHIRYACQIWGQSNSKTFDMIQSTQNKALRIINFQQALEPSEPLYQNVKKNKLKNKTILSNCLFVFDKLTKKLPDAFDQFIQSFKQQNNLNNRASQQYLRNTTKTDKQIFASNSIKIKSINDWNEIIDKIHFSSELLFKRAEFVKRVKNSFHNR